MMFVVIICDRYILYHSYSVLCLTNMLSEAFTVIVHCKKYPLRHMWVLADTLLWFQAITLKWYMRSREIANANCIVFGFIRSGTQYGYVSHYTTEAVTYAHIYSVRNDMDENDYPFLYLDTIRVKEQCLDCCFTLHSHSSEDTN